MTKFSDSMKEIHLPDDLKRCIDFHGHLCPGVVIGYLATKLAMRLLEVGRAEDEELVAVVENDTCAVDAVQVLSGCTFGKGNFKFLDYGKLAFSFGVRPHGRSIRLLYRHSSRSDSETGSGQQSRSQRIQSLLASEPEEWFDVQHGVWDVLPEPAQIYTNALCEGCGERAMSPRIKKKQGRWLCVSCTQKQTLMQNQGELR